MIKIDTYSHWSKIRLLSLIITFVSISLSGIYYFYFFYSSNSPKATINFPQSIPLKDWKLQSRTPLKLRPSKEEKAIQGYQYRYSKKQQQLTIEISNIKYSGNINQFLIFHKNIPPATVLIQEYYQPNIGYYGLFEYQEKTYLTACLNPQGYSTLTEKQFTENRYRYGGGIQQTLRWIIGQDDLFNGQCLWTLISLDTQDSSSLNDNVNLELKAIWLDWYRGWKQDQP